MFFKHFCSVRIKDIIIIVYHDDMEGYGELLMSPRNTKTLSVFFDYCNLISATVALQCASPKSESSFKRACSIVRKLGIGMTQEQMDLFNEAVKEL